MEEWRHNDDEAMAELYSKAVHMVDVTPQMSSDEYATYVLNWNMYCTEKMKPEWFAEVELALLKETARREIIDIRSRHRPVWP